MINTDVLNLKVRQLMKGFNRVVGENFMAIVTTEVMTTMSEIARGLLMSHTLAQWLYVISDTNVHNGNLSSLISALYEGENIAFMYNITDDDPECKVSELISFGDAYFFFFCFVLYHEFGSHLVINISVSFPYSCYINI